MVVLKNGIIEDRLSEDQLLLNEFSDKKKTLKIVAVGRLIPLKRFDTLIKAAAVIIEQGFYDLSVLIIGDGEERLQLEKMIYDLKIGEYVELLGIRDDVIEIMRWADIFVIPSSYEGLSIAMIEAMACGLPVIASDAPGLKDYIDQEGNGLLFEIENHKALAECILLLANNKMLLKKLSKGARDTFEREYDIRENIKPLDALFRKCVKRPMKRVN